MVSSEAANAGQIAAPVVYFTYDEERTEHIISEDKLMLVANGGKDTSLEICIGAFGVAFGYLQNGVNVFMSVSAGKPVDAWQGIGAAIFLTASVTFVVTALYHKRTSASVSELLTQIRSRKTGVMSAPPYAGGKPFEADLTKDTSSTTG